MVLDYELILAIAGGITTIGAALVVLRNGLKALKKPTDDLNSQVARHETRIANLDEITHNNLDRIKDTHKMQLSMAKCMVCICNHMIDGNHTENMKKERDELLELIQNSASRVNQ